MKRNVRLCIWLLFLMGLGCQKILDKKADAGLDSPQTVADCQMMLENDIVTVKSTPGLGPIGGDDYALSPVTLTTLSLPFLGLYAWNPTLYQGQGVTDDSWFNPHQAINRCNLVLNSLETVPHSNSADQAGYYVVRGMALFDRSFHFLNLEETFGQPCRPASAMNDQGIPLQLSADAMAPLVPATVKEVFAQVVKDLLEAVQYLPPAPQPEAPNRPSRPAAFALLARAALIQQDYRSARDYADSCLRLYSLLMDYDTVKGSPTHPFYFVGNPEVLFQCSAVAFPMLYSTTTTVDSGLYASYAFNDLRRTLFFEPSPNGQEVYFKGYYSQGHFIFSGIAVDEVMLIRAESRVRLQDPAGAIADVNTLLSHRWKKSTYVPYTAGTAEDVLKLVLLEKRKETLFREVRWSDLRRLNQSWPTADTLKRVLGDSVKLLPPNSPMYTWPVPLSETEGH